MARSVSSRWDCLPARRADRLTVGLFIPISGAAGIWGPSCRACAELAAAELNARGGIAGREIVFRIVDAGGDPLDVSAAAEVLIEEGEIDAIVGMHTSDVRAGLARAISGVVPYVYTPLYEGGERHPGVFCIGETPDQQLLPGLDWLAERYRARNWYLIGNDYVWPRTTHALVRRHFALQPRAILGESYVPFGTADMEPLVERIREARPDAVLVSLVGQDSIAFNRTFGRAGLGGRILRFSCAVEENMLLGMGEAHVDGLFASAGYFSVIRNRSNGSFLERYQQHFGDRGPALNTIGQNVYEGVHFLLGLAASTQGRDWRSPAGPIPLGGVRRAVYGGDRISRAPMYLAEAQGYEFRIRQTFP
jgi:ABC-type branched-subunit amino acid transport system substrate-binding protein